MNGARIVENGWEMGEVWRREEIGARTGARGVKIAVERRGTPGRVFRAFGRADMDVERLSERRAHNLLAAARLRSIPKA